VTDAQSSKAVASGEKKSPAKLIFFILVVIGLAVAASQFGVGEKLEQATAWIDSLGKWGAAAFIGIYAVATIAMAPGSILTAAAGGLFGSFWGIIYTMIGAMIGACSAFLIARYFARETVSSKLAGSEKFRRLDALTEKNGAVIVAIVRLVPIFPFNLVNYMFGLTKVPFAVYALYSLLILPGTALYVVGTDAVVTGLREGRVPWGLLGVLAFVVVIVALLVKQAKKKISDDSESSN
jgi:uncharacterized membrane protein YdjX (TVP38/TMEM64 family)